MLFASRCGTPMVMRHDLLQYLSPAGRLLDGHAVHGRGLMVMDPGECDGDVAAPAGGRGSVMISPPEMGEMASLGGADSGYLEAWLNPNGTLERCGWR